MTTTVHPATPVQPTDARQGLIQGLHDLAAFLHENPDVPVNTWQEIAYCVPGDDTAGMANLAAIAAAAGVDVTATGGGPVTADTSHANAVVRFGPVVYRATYIRSAEMADYDALMSYRGTIRAEQAVTA